MYFFVFRDTAPTAVYTLSLHDALPISGSVTSSVATLTVNSPPTITTQPASRTVTAGQTASFSVTATGTAPLSYQWQRVGVPICGATPASYTTPSTTSGDNGAQFTVVVSNTAGSVTS